MLLSLQIRDKSFGAKALFRDLAIKFEKNEKVAIIGRNGAGKTTLFRILTSIDHDFDGKLQVSKAVRVVSTQQEFDENDELSTQEYIRDNLPEYTELNSIIESAHKPSGDEQENAHKLSHAVERFTQLGYFDIEKKIIKMLEQYQITKEQAKDSFNKLSGGEKRFADLVRVELSEADLILADEPTNHMDYVAKQAFINWLKNHKEAVAVITHDRDVLAEVEKIIEIKDKTKISFKGNYDSYLLQNSQHTVNQLGTYEDAQKEKEKLKKRVEFARANKAHASGGGGKKNTFVVMEEKALRQIAHIEALEKPSFWIDQESVDNLSDKVTSKYNQFKSKNINISANAAGKYQANLVAVKSLSLGYNEPLFEGISFSVSSEDRLHVKGRNGVGKSTLIKAIIGAITDAKQASKTFGGSIEPSSDIKLGVYEQEVSSVYLKQKLGEAVENIYRQHNLPVNDQLVRQTMASYLFNPSTEYSQTVASLSGGQKARLQLIGMLAHEPNLLILDEPTNHLDLPSIEELENALIKYSGGIIYVSHDSYFCQNLGGAELNIP